MGGSRLEDHQANAIVVVGYIAWAFREHLHRSEGSAVALVADAAAHLVVGVAVVVVGAGPVRGDAGDVRDQ